MSPAPPPGPPAGRTGNRLLDRLPEDEAARLAPRLAPASLELKQVLIQGDAPIRDAYFPTTALISSLVVMGDGGEVETGLTGPEGMVGLAVALGVDFGLSKSICQVAGAAWRLPAGALREAVERGRGADRLFRRYAAVQLRQAGQLAACHALHPVPERLCQWLLMSHDRMGRDEFPMTQEFLAEQLGVRRQTVTVEAGRLQAAGLIRLRRGTVRVVDRVRLEEASCECYGCIRSLYARVLP